ncbi:isochorismatase [Citrobacter koseri]|uniref:Isochorismatase n=1 Tax=Citrobacter koseri TaxID=545 RepID=A0A2X2UXN1_CITKO|nr:isochorismatase [Citrobacter koseri]
MAGVTFTDLKEKERWQFRNCRRTRCLARLDIPPNKVNWAFEPERAALLIHDMQDVFCQLLGDNCPMMEQVIANIAALRQYCKEHNIPVYYTAQPKDQSDEDRALLNDMWGPGLTRSPSSKRLSMRWRRTRRTPCW